MAEYENIDWTNLTEEEEEQIRTIKYSFKKSFFDIKEIGTELIFSVGD